MKYLIMCKSLTNAQRSALLLERKGISASLVKAPQNLRANGCGYALSIYRRLPEAISILKSANLLTGKVYRREEDGSYREAELHDLS
jgi:Protein of unknown function (DUF3343).